MSLHLHAGGPACPLPGRSAHRGRSPQKVRGQKVTRGTSCSDVLLRPAAEVTGCLWAGELSAMRNPRLLRLGALAGASQPFNASPQSASSPPRCSGGPSWTRVLPGAEQASPSVPRGSSKALRTGRAWVWRRRGPAEQCHTCASAARPQGAGAKHPRQDLPRGPAGALPAISLLRLRGKLRKLVTNTPWLVSASGQTMRGRKRLFAHS